MIDPFIVAFVFAGIMAILMALSYVGSLIYQLSRENDLFNPKSIGCLLFIVLILLYVHPLIGNHVLGVLASVGAVMLEVIWGLKAAVMSLCDDLRRVFTSRQPASNAGKQQVVLRHAIEQPTEQRSHTPTEADINRCYRQREVCDNVEERLTKSLQQNNSYASEWCQLDQQILDLQYNLIGEQSRVERAENNLRKAQARVLAHETDGATIARLEAEVEDEKVKAHDADVCRKASHSHEKYLRGEIESQKAKFRQYALHKEDQIGVLRTEIKALQRKQDNPPRVELLAVGTQTEEMEATLETTQQSALIVTDRNEVLLNNLEDQLVTTQAELAATQAKLSLNRTSATSAAFERFIIKTQMDDLKAESQNTEYGLLTTIAELRVELIRNQAQATAATEWQVAQQDTKTSTLATIVALQTELANVKAEAKSTIESQGAQIQEAAGFKAEAERVVADLRDETEHMRQENDNLKHQVEQTAAQSPQIALMQQEAEQMRLEKEYFQQQVEQLTNQNSQIAILQQEKDAATQKARVVEEEAMVALQAKAAQMTQLSFDLRKARDETTQAEEDVYGFTQELEEEQEKLLNALQAEKAALHTIADLKVARDDFCAETERLSVKVQRLVNENTKLTTEMKKFANEQLLKANLAKKGKTQELSNKDGILELLKKTHETELQRKQTKLDERKATIEKLASQYAESCAGNTRLRDKAKRGREDITLLVSRVRDLEGQLQDPNSRPKLNALQVGSVATILQQIGDGKHPLSLGPTPAKKPESAQGSGAKMMRPMKPLPNRRKSEQPRKSEAGPSEAMEK
ncbi:hypothetical protein BDP55DRAFT_639315 [Colletotrichum godetiae]|uniref:Uncharacterized protein n=1 Tax=Colletotrichum godetiae TaxID=1209918 RepID=A0AAJ0A5B5_9PEZI|nr:uncharacterized protein BDP55DRAFT_639315 [Colletotrichum godetiae]KAK1656799.1 hypothetical protein BDP55DRAFT_639315 [Colletotrichum godetiae]